VAKFFTVEEANALLPRIKVLMEAMFALREEAAALQPNALPALEKAASNGGNRPAGELLEIFIKLEQPLRELQGLGCVLKGLEHGLVDFPAIMHGRQVFLCWKYGEPEVGFWHDLDTGFAGRQPIPKS
jgi:hypothetical protein